VQRGSYNSFIFVNGTKNAQSGEIALQKPKKTIFVIDQFVFSLFIYFSPFIFHKQTFLMQSCDQFSCHNEPFHFHAVPFLLLPIAELHSFHGALVIIQYYCFFVAWKIEIRIPHALSPDKNLR